MAQRGVSIARLAHLVWLALHLTLTRSFVGYWRDFHNRVNVWPEIERKLWLQLLEGGFKLIYKDSEETKTIPEWK